MIRVDYLFFITGVLMIIFAFLVIPSETHYHYYFLNNYYSVVARPVFLVLASLALLFGVLYKLTERFLFSNTWSIMHFICFVCLIINIWTWGIFERVFLEDYFNKASMLKQTSRESEIFTKYQSIYLNSALILIILQLTYVANLIYGMIFQKLNKSS